MWGNAGVLSFGGSKLLTAGRGGAVLTNDNEIAQRIRLYTQRGNEAYPLSELQAAVLLPQLAGLDERNALRLDRVRLLEQLLGAEHGLRPFRNEPPHSPVTTHHSPRAVYYKLGFQYEPRAFQGLTREAFVAAMRAEGIACDAGFRSLAATHSQRRFRASGNLTNAADADRRVVTLHHPVLLGSDDDIRQITAALAKVRAFASTIQEQCGQEKVSQS
jgi:dTDP-4-amino-4,6-dideoxygalactose transaminase